MLVQRTKHFLRPFVGMSFKIGERCTKRRWAAADAHFVRGSKGEACAHNGKIEQSQAPPLKRGVCRGYPRSLFWPEILLSPIMRSRSKRIVMQSSSESSAEHALVDALGLCSSGIGAVLGHRSRPTLGSAKARHKGQWLGCPKPLLQPRPQVLDLPYSARADSHCPHAVQVSLGAIGRALQPEDWRQ